MIKFALIQTTDLCNLAENSCERPETAGGISEANNSHVYHFVLIIIYCT